MNYVSNGQVLYNEKTGKDYPFDATKGHYIDPTTGYIVVRKVFLAQNNLLDDSPVQSALSPIQPFSNGETVYLLTDPTTPWTVTQVWEYNMVITNKRNGQNKVVDETKVTRNSPSQKQQQTLEKPPSSDLSPAQSSLSPIQTYYNGDIVYLLTDPITPWIVTNVWEYNMVITNTSNGQNKVVYEKDVTRNPQSQQQQIFEKPPSPDFYPDNSPLQTPAIHFQPNIIVSTGANSQVSSPTPLDTQSAQATTSPTVTTPQYDFFDKPVISKQKADSNTSSLLSGGSFKVKMV
jgi:hypothetical protein